MVRFQRTSTIPWGSEFTGIWLAKAGTSQNGAPSHRALRLFSDDAANPSPRPLINLQIARNPTAADDPHQHVFRAPRQHRIHDILLRPRPAAVHLADPCAQRFVGEIRIALVLRVADAEAVEIRAVLLKDGAETSQSRPAGIGKIRARQNCEILRQNLLGLRRDGHSQQRSGDEKGLDLSHGTF